MLSNVHQVWTCSSQKVVQQMINHTRKYAVEIACTIALICVAVLIVRGFWYLETRAANACLNVCKENEGCTDVCRRVSPEAARSLFNK